MSATVAPTLPAPSTSTLSMFLFAMSSLLRGHAGPLKEL
jgi:hypothetical protein